MLIRFAAIAMVASAAIAAFGPESADAGTRLRFHYAPLYGAYEPEWIPPGYYYYYDEPEPFRFYEYDEGYYEPEYVEPEHRIPVKPRQKQKPAASANQQPAKKKMTAKAEPATSGLSCAKAGEIVAGFGFTAVKAEDCDGKVYAFNASRDGKAFAIKLSAASGELTEVKKLQ